RVAEVDRREVVPVVRPADVDAPVGEAALPAQQAIAVGDLKREVVRPADARATACGGRPLEERDSRAGAANLVAKIQMIGVGQVEVHRELDQPQAEHARVKIDGALRLSADQRNVVQTLNHTFPLAAETGVATALIVSGGEPRRLVAASFN